MELGTIVYSKSGHDAHRFYVVVDRSEGWVYIADGKRRKLEKPKRKNPRHLAKTARQVELSEVDTDQKLRRLLWDYNNAVAENRQGR